jgi:hypothetical protein
MPADAIDLHAEHHGFGLLDNGDLDEPSADYSNGLIVILSSGAKIYTGVYSGLVAVTLRLTGQAPEPSSLDEWDEIVEAPIVSTAGQLWIETYEGGRVPGFPILSSKGPGNYRLRAHARGRDKNYDHVCDKSEEEYLLILWPAEPAPTEIIKVTDRCGASLRSPR